MLASGLGSATDESVLAVAAYGLQILPRRLAHCCLLIVTE
jgi:hypothetical protein